jgi:hypothetical protein
MRLLVPRTLVRVAVRFSAPANRTDVDVAGVHAGHELRDHERDEREHQDGGGHPMFTLAPSWAPPRQTVAFGSREVIQLSYRGSRTPTGFLFLRVWDLIRRGPKIENTRVRDRDPLHDGVRRYIGIRRARVLEENTTIEGKCSSCGASSAKTKPSPSRAGRLDGIIEPGPGTSQSTRLTGSYDDA